MLPFHDLLPKLATELTNLKIPYMIMVSQAVLLYGEPRLTKSIDITIGLIPDDFELIVPLINNLNLNILPPSPEEFVKETWVLPVLYPMTGIRVDITFSLTEFEQQAI